MSQRKEQPSHEGDNFLASAERSRRDARTFQFAGRPRMGGAFNLTLQRFSRQRYVTQADVYKQDFLCEREDRSKLHAQNEHLDRLLHEVGCLATR